MMDAAQAQQDEQAILWNGEAGRAWVEAQDLLDRLFAPVETLLVDAVGAEAPRHVLDIGCGTGATTVAFARSTGAACLGVDISEPMIEAARERASAARVPAAFLRADAGTYAFEPGGFDMIASRFGVMFFDDPVRALANLRKAVRKDGALRFVVWRAAQENPFMTAAERAAAPLLPELPPRDPNGPGQFGFADAARVRRFLEQAGWAGIDIRPADVPCAMAEADLETYFTRLGPVARVLGGVEASLRGRVMERVRAAFEPYVHGSEVRFTAACWMIAARAA